MAWIVERDPKTLDLALLRSRKLIGIDGDNGAGKSTLGRELANALGGTLISVDDFLLGNGAAYLEQVDFAKLSQTVQAGREPIVVEGILLQDVLATIAYEPDFSIFVRSEHIGITMYGGSPEIADYYRRRSPWKVAQTEVTLRFVYQGIHGPISTGA